MQKFVPKQFIIKLCALPERQGKQETKAAQLILNTLSEHSITCTRERFTTFLPRITKNNLTIDGKKLSAIPTSLVGGIIQDKHALISSLISSQKCIRDSNINFNPASKTISRSNHYFAPSFAIKASDVSKVCRAEKVFGEIKVRKIKHISENMLVGNITNPKNILFCHYDSFGPGAIDNASGTALLLDLIINHPATLESNLFVIAGNEELSFDFPIYWGHGYRVFEQKYKKILTRAKRIFAVDCIGNGEPVFDNFSPIVPLSFPIKNLERWRKKIFAVYGDEEKLMKVYHSNLDTPNLIKNKFMETTKQSLLTQLL